MKNATAKKDEPISDALQAVLDHQQAVKAAADKLAQLEAAAAGIDAKIAAAESRRPSHAHYDEELENMLAAAALGQVTQDEVKAREEEIAKEKRSVFEASEIVRTDIARLTQTRNGMQRGLDAVRAELQALGARTQELLRDLLLHEAERACAAYVDGGRKAIEGFSQVHALNQLLKSHAGYDRNLLGYSRERFCLPKLDLPPCEGFGHESIRFGSVWFTPDMSPPFGINDKDVIARETDRLRACGVELP